MADNFKTLRNGISLGNLAADPANGANGDFYYNTTQNSYRGYSNGSWGSIGGAGGSSGGVNFIGLNSSLQLATPDNVNAGSSLGTWIVYQDTAGAVPVTMNGTVTDPSPITLTRTTTAGQVLNGMASFLITKLSANKQGEGVSVSTYVPPGYAGQQLIIQMPYKLISGSLNQGDLGVFVYDITNSKLISPTNNQLVDTQGILTASFNLPTSTAQIRFGIHFESTVTNALELSFVDVFVGYVDNGASLLTPGISGTNWEPYNLVIGVDSGTPPTYGTTSINNAQWRRVGGNMEIQYSLVQGTGGSAGSGNYLFPLPSGYEIDTTVLSLDTGTFSNPTIGSSTTDTQTGIVGLGIVTAYDTTNLSIAVIDNPTGGNQSGQVSSSFFNLSSNMTYSFTASVPIAGWTVSNGTNLAPGMSGFDWTPYTPTLSAFGTVSNTNFFYRRVGDSVEVTGSFISGTAMATPGVFDLPSGLVIDSNKSNINTIVGLHETTDDSTATFVLHCIINNAGTQVIGSRRFGTNNDSPLNDENANALYATGAYYAVKFSVPILGWTSNNGPGQSGFQLFTSSQVTTDSSVLSSASFTTFSNSPGFSFTPTTSGKYKINCVIPVIVSASGSGASIYTLRVFNTAGTATLLYESQAGGYVETSSTGGSGISIQSIYSLTAGNSATFDFQGKISNSGNMQAVGSGIGPFYIFAELIG